MKANFRPAANRIQLSGYAVTHPVIRVINDSSKVGRITLSVRDYYKNERGENVLEEQYFLLAFWNSKIHLYENLITKGSLFSVRGKLSAKLPSHASGQAEFRYEIIVDEISIIKI